MIPNRLQNIGRLSTNDPKFSHFVQKEFDDVRARIEQAKIASDGSGGISVSGATISQKPSSSTQDGYMSATQAAALASLQSTVGALGTITPSRAAQWDAAYAHSLIVESNPHQTKLNQIYDPSANTSLDLGLNDILISSNSAAVSWLMEPTGHTFTGTVDFASPVTGIALNEIENLTADKVFNMTTRQLSFRWTNPAGNPFELEASGNYSGALLHIHQHTGNPGAGAHLVEVEAEDLDVEMSHWIAAAADQHVIDIWIDGDTQDRLNIRGDGSIHFGDGTSLDVRLIHSGAGILTLDSESSGLAYLRIGGATSGHIGQFLFF